MIVRLNVVLNRTVVVAVLFRTTFTRTIKLMQPTLEMTPGFKPFTG